MPGTLLDEASGLAWVLEGTPRRHDDASPRYAPWLIGNVGGIAVHLAQAPPGRVSAGVAYVNDATAPWVIARTEGVSFQQRMAERSYSRLDAPSTVEVDGTTLVFDTDGRPPGPDHLLLRGRATFAEYGGLSRRLREAHELSRTDPPAAAPELLRGALEALTYESLEAERCVRPLLAAHEDSLLEQLLERANAFALEGPLPSRWTAVLTLRALLDGGFEPARRPLAILARSDRPFVRALALALAARR